MRGPRNNRSFENDEVEKTGQQVTEEQVQDVYSAGTSDGVMFLGNGRVMDADQSADHDQVDD